MSDDNTKYRVILRRILGILKLLEWLWQKRN